MARIPSQRNRCTKHAWCVARSHGHPVHQGAPQSLTTSAGTELRLSLSAEDDDAPTVLLEATFESGGAMLEIAELDVPEAIELAEFLLRLAGTTQVTRGSLR
jgi:hypothetical protein